MKIRAKILSGFLILAALLAVAGSFSIIEFSKISQSVKAILDNNYRSIDASKAMIEALEREDSGILLQMLGHWEEGRKTVEQADSVFMAAFGIAENNITENKEEEVIIKTRETYMAYKKLWQRPIVYSDSISNMNWYFTDLHPSFITVKNSVRELMSINQNSMYNTATILREKARRAIMPGIVAIIAAISFSIIFSFLLNFYLVNPLKRIINKIDNITYSSMYFDSKIETKDELRELEVSIRNLINRLRN